MNKLWLLLGLMALVLASFGSAVCDTSNLVSNTMLYYKLEEGANPYVDAVGKLNLTLGNTPDMAAGQIDFGQDFAVGNSDYLQTASTTAFNHARWTWNFWMRADSSTVITTPISYFESSGDYTGCYLQFRDSNIFTAVCYKGSTTNNIATTSTTTLADSTTAMITWSYDGTDMHLYINNVEMAYSSKTTGAINTGTPIPITIGWDTPAAGRYFDGMIDELAFYNVSLSSDCRAYLYNSGSPQSSQQYPYSNSSPTPFSTSLSYPLNQATYYGNYNGSIIATLANVNGSASCSINDSRWTLQGGPTFGNETVQWLNNTAINQNNVSISINCTDNSITSILNFWFYQETILEMYIFDEQTLILLSKSISLDLISDDYVNNYTFNQNYSIYSLPAATYELSYTAEDYIQRQYYLTITEGKKHIINLYLLNDSIGTQEIGTIYDEYGNELPSYYIYTYRRILGNYTLIEISKTNSDGKGDFYVLLNTPMYYWTIKDQNFNTVFITQESEVYGTTLAFNVNLGGVVDHVFSKLGDYVYSLAFDNNTNIWTYIFVDSSGGSTYNKLAVYKLPSRTLVLQNGTTATSGTLTIDMSSVYVNGSTYIASITANASPEFQIDVESYTYPDYPTEIGEIGLLMTAFILLLVAGIGYWNPAVMFILEAVAFILTRAGGLHHFSYTTTSIVAIIMLILAYLVSDRT